MFNTLEFCWIKAQLMRLSATWLGALAIIGSVATSATRAQEGDPQRGLSVVQDICASCHAVHRGERSPNVNAPPFTTIADVPGHDSHRTSSGVANLAQNNAQRYPSRRLPEGCDRLYLEFEVKLAVDDHLALQALAASGVTECFANSLALPCRS